MPDLKSNMISHSPLSTDWNGLEGSDKINQNFSLVWRSQGRRLYPWAAGVVPCFHILILLSLLKHKRKKKKQQAKKKILIWFFSLNSLQGDRPKKKCHSPLVSERPDAVLNVMSFKKWGLGFKSEFLTLDINLVGSPHLIFSFFESLA